MYTENIYMNAHISIIHNRQTWKQAQKFINQWMNKQNEVYLNKNLSATKSNEVPIYTTMQMNLEKHYAKRKKAMKEIQ